MALAKIADDAELPTTLVTLGDYVDRGPDSRQVIELLMAGLGPKGWRLICLKVTTRTSCGRPAVVTETQTLIERSGKSAQC
jgi:hypothetical protein